MLRIRHEKFGDAEVQQLRLAAGIHQHIGSLEVAVQDQPLVGGVNGCAHQAKQGEPLPDIERSRITEGIDGLARDILEHQVGSTLFGSAGIEQPRHVRMLQ